MAERRRLQDLHSTTKSLRNLNMKKLSLTLPSPHSSTNSLDAEPHSALTFAPSRTTRRPSVISLPATANSLVHRKEGGDDAVPYADGPVQIIPGIWLGSEDNARDWKGLIERGIKSILNVAKEVSCPLDPDHSLRPVSSTPDFKKQPKPDSTYHPPNIVSGRPGFHYLKLQWSHGQQDLVQVGFQAAMSFTDAALARGEGVLIHCQCGISRSATMVIALVMRAAAEQSSSVPPEVWALKGMQGAYSYVKQKSKCVGPNMSLIYQLLDYEKKLKQTSPSASEKSSLIDEEAEWGRQRKLLDEMPDDDEPDENTFIIREAQALDKAMEERVVARQSSASSLASSSNSGVGMGPAWRIRYANQRKRTGSIASSATGCSSRLSENLVEEEEEEELLGVRGGFEGRISADPSDSSASPDDDEDEATPPRASVFTLKTTRPKALSTAPVWNSSFTLAPPPVTPFKSTFTLPPPPTATRPSFDIPPTPHFISARSIPPPRGKRRPVPIGILPPVPSSPIAVVVESTPPSVQSNNSPQSRSPALSLPPVRVRTTSSILPPPLHLRNNHLFKTATTPTLDLFTPSQTLFVFPPSPTTLTSRTPSTMTLTSNMGGNGPVPFPSLSTPRVSTFRSQGRTRSFIGLGALPAPTTGFSKVDARGYVGLE